ncbi:MAG: hypothetical protein KC413_18075 [Anaerolineales bacterium]|nr:hypothetical protein [Anaerolineales bacterium]
MKHAIGAGKEHKVWETTETGDRLVGTAFNLDSADEIIKLERAIMRLEGNPNAETAELWIEIISHS